MGFTDYRAGAETVSKVFEDSRAAG